MSQLVVKIAYACTMMDDESNYMYIVRKSSDIYLTRTTGFRYSTNEKYSHLNKIHRMEPGTWANTLSPSFSGRDCVYSMIKTKAFGSDGQAGIGN